MFPFFHRAANDLSCLKCESGSRHIQPGEGPISSWNRWIVFSSTFYEVTELLELLTSEMVNMSSAWPSGGEGVYTQWTHKTRENKWKLSLLILKLEKTKNKPIYVNGDGKFWFWWFNSSSSLVSLYPFWLWQTDKNKIKGLGSILSSILRGVWFQVNWMKYFLWLHK